MAAYLPGSNVQADTIQTLHLMNPSFNTCAEAVPIPNDATNSTQHQQSFMGYSMPPLLSHSQAPSLQAMFTPQQSPSGPFSSRVSPYTWTTSTTTNEVPFMSSGEATPLTYVFASKYASMTPESQLSHFNMARQAVQEGAAIGSNVAHALSLSLSPGRHPTQMPYYDSMQSETLGAIPDLTYVVGDRSEFKGDRLPNTGYATHGRASSADGALAANFQNYMNDMTSRHVHAHTQPEVSSSGGFFTASKYLKAVQQLLNEVVSVEEAIKKSSLSNKYAKTRSWSAQGDMSGFVQGMAETGREGMAWGLSIAKAASCPDLAPLPNVELTPQAKQELQMKKAKLMAMLEEVDRRYKLYRNQMQAIVSLFETAAGAGAAKCYTALALQTISRHFRCLRDAIAGQVRVAGKGLGEEEHLSSQHRVLQQLHMMHQHAWRPQRGLPERAVSVLRAWLFEHFLHPYPKDADKVLLAKQTGLTRNQVSNWFINARVRLWKPMVEEMYQEESKDADAPSSQRLNDTEDEQDELRIISATQKDSHRGIDPNLLGSLSSDYGTTEGGDKENQLQDPSTSIAPNSNLAEAAVGGADACFSLHEWQSAKKARNSMDSFVSKTEVYPNLQGEDDKLSYMAMRGMESQSYGPYLSIAGASRGNAASALGSNNVSLTLGLQHSDPLEAQHPQTQQQHLFFHHLQEPAYVHGHEIVQHVPHQLPDGLLERGNNNAISASQNYYSSMQAATGLSGNSFEVLSRLQNQKQLSGHALHPDFT